MATPSSSTTSPSPPMAYLSHLSHLSHAPGQQQASMVSQNEIDREQRNKAVQKFLARAEISMVSEFRSHQTRPPRGNTSDRTVYPFILFQSIRRSPTLSTSSSSRNLKLHLLLIIPTGYSCPTSASFLCFI